MHTMAILCIDQLSGLNIKYQWLYDCAQASILNIITFTRLKLKIPE